MSPSLIINECMKLFTWYEKESKLDEGKVQGITSFQVNHDWKRFMVSMWPFCMTCKHLYKISPFLTS